MPRHKDDLRRAPHEMFRVICYDQYEYEDYVVGDYATAKEALHIARQHATHTNAFPPDFSDISLVYNDQGECIEEAGYDRYIFRPFSAIKIILSLLFVCFLGLITDPSAPGLIFGSCVVILLISMVYIKNSLKTRKDRTLRLLSQSYVLILCAHLFLASVIIFDYFNIRLSDSLSDSATGILSGTIFFFLILSAYYFQKTNRYQNRTIFFLISACICLAFGSVIFCDDTQLKLFSLPVDETGVLLGTILPLTLISVYLFLSYKHLGSAALSIVLVMMNVFIILVSGLSVIAIESTHRGEMQLWFTGTLLGGLLGATVLIYYYFKSIRINTQLSKLIIVSGIAVGLVAILVSAIKIFQETAILPNTLKVEHFGIYFSMFLSTLLVLGYLYKNRKTLIQQTKYFLTSIFNKTLFNKMPKIIAGITKTLVICSVLAIYLSIAIFYHHNRGISDFLQLLSEHRLLTIPTPYFINFLMRDQYLWYQNVPQPFTINYNNNTEQIFEDLVYKKEDKWSYFQSKQADQNLHNKAEFYGFGMELFQMNEHDIRVAYVYENSSAGKNGVLRGDYLIGIDGYAIGDVIKEGIWNDFFADENKKAHDFYFKDKDGNKYHKTLELTPSYIDAAPIHRIIEQDGRKIGYLFFKKFLNVFYKDLQKIFKKFKREGVTELILDLRYNGGGEIHLSRYLGWWIAGEHVAGKVFLKEMFNNKYKDLNREIDFLPNYMISDTQKHETLGLKRVIVITSRGTASASETLIMGLKPYIDVILIGSHTHGKSVAMTPYSYDEYSFNIVTCFMANSRGEIIPKTGIRPTYKSLDDLDRKLGDIEEESIKTALYYIAHGSCPKEIQ